jgi:hypothetical protein
MIAKELCLVALVTAASLACVGCQPAAQPPVGSQQGGPPVKKRTVPKLTRTKLDDDFSRVRLLVAEAVQKDLGLSTDQIGKVRDFVKTGNERSREVSAKLGEMFPPSRRFKPGEFEAANREFRVWYEEYKGKNKEVRKNLLAMLTPSQSERLDQIRLQVAIPAALARPDIIKALDISEEQLAKIRAMCDQLESDLLAQQLDLGSLTPKERRQKLIEYANRLDKGNREAATAILDVLTPKQLAKLETFLGRKVEVVWSYDALGPEDIGAWTDVRTPPAPTR